jgi:glycosyltransferase involved in cell wall biosynthesis
MASRARARGSAETISVVLHDLAPGGSERIALRLANRWAELGRSVRLVCGSDAGALQPMIGPNLSIETITPNAPRGRGSRSRLAAGLRRVLQRTPGDLVFLPGNYHWPVARGVARLAPSERPCLVAQISNPLRRTGRNAICQSIFEARSRWFLEAASSAVALSEVARAEADVVFGRRFATAIPLPALQDERRSPVNPPAGPPLILAIGRLAPQKNFDLAIRAFAGLSAPDARLVILGEGPQRQALSRLVDELGLAGRVELPGYVADVAPWLDRARLVLVSSRFEGYGAVIIEALAAGRPVVATPCGGGVADVCARPDAGVVATGHDVQALTAALALQLAKPPPDPGALAQSVKHFQIGPIAEAYLDLFDAACRRTPAPLAQPLGVAERPPPARLRELADQGA